MSKKTNQIDKVIREQLISELKQKEFWNVFLNEEIEKKSKQTDAARSENKILTEKLEQNKSAIHSAYKKLSEEENKAKSLLNTQLSLRNQISNYKTTIVLLSIGIIAIFFVMFAVIFHFNYN